MSKDRILSVGTVVLAFLASQHHALGMLLLAGGIGGASASVMTTVPLLRRAMLAVTLVMVAVMAYRTWDARRPKAARVTNAVSIVLSLGLIGWSVTRWGL
jgi:hypothetical protein